MPRRKDPKDMSTGRGNPREPQPPFESETGQPAAADADVEGVAPETLALELTVGASPLDLPAAVFEAGLARRKRNRAALLDWIRTALVEGTDYGRLHLVSKARCPFAQAGQVQQCPTPSHWSKPGLFKPGAEKLCGLLGVVVRFPTLAAYEQAALRGEPSIDTVILRCELQDGAGHVVAEGMAPVR